MQLIRSVWRGEVRLWATYWLWGVAGNMTFVLVLAVLALLGGAASELWLWAVWLVSLAWFVFVFGAIWRAAGRHRGPRIWAVLARLGVCLGIVRMAGEAAALAAW